MDVKDLMIGDIIKWGDECFIVSLIDIDGNICVEDLDRNKDYDYIHGVEPAPLTEEILKANGFEFDEHGYDATYRYSDFSLDEEGWHNERIFVIEDWYKKDESTEFPYIKIAYGTYAPIHYVHELQHALRLCGLSDLADNFKLTTA